MRILRSPAWTPSIIIVIALGLYLVAAYWVWGGGWISQRGFYDFAGGATVHLLAGVCALMGSLVAGPRSGHTWGSVPPVLQTLGFGVALVLFGLLAYAPADMLTSLGSGLGGTLVSNGLVAALCGAAAACAADSFRQSAWRTRALLPGLFAGIAAVSAGWVWMNLIGAAVAGVAAGVAFVLVSRLLNLLHIDDTLGIFAAHGVGGALGTVLVGLFLDGSITGSTAGLLMGGDGSSVTNQFIGLIGIVLFAGLVSTAVLIMLKSSGYLRAPERRQRVMLFDEHDYPPTAAESGESR